MPVTQEGQSAPTAVPTSQHGGVDVDVEPATEHDRPALSQLLEMNARRFSELDGREVDPPGSYEYPFLHLYFADPERRRAYLIRVGGHDVGCALVRTGTPHQMAEFFVIEQFRRSGVGTTAARSVFSLHPGAWSLQVVAGNDAAATFWRRVIPVDFSEAAEDGATTLAFTSATGNKP